jgi:hypothetical protein
MKRPAIRTKIIGSVGTPQISNITRIPETMMIILAIFDTTEIRDCIAFVLAMYNLISFSLKPMAVHIKERVKRLASPSPTSLLTAGESIET